MDRRAACMTYKGDAYTDASAWNYFEKSKERRLMHPELEKQLGYILMMLRDEGEQIAFRYLKEEVLQGKPFPWEK